MIQSCNFLAPDGSVSLVADHLIQKYGPERAFSIWEKLHSDELLVKTYNWQINADGKMPNGELTPLAAEAVVQAFENKEKFTGFAMPQIELNSQPEIPTSEAAQPVEDSPVKIFDLTLDKYNDKVKALLSGDKTIILRNGNIFKLEPGEKAIVYIKGLPFNIEHKGFLTAAEFGGDLAALEALGEDDSANFNENSSAYKWISGATKQSVYEISPIQKVSDLTEEAGIKAGEKTELLKVDPLEVEVMMKSMFAEIINAEGIPTGRYFSEVQQKNGVDFIVNDVYKHLKASLANGDNLTVRSLLAGLTLTKQRLGFYVKALKAVVDGTPIKNFKQNSMPVEEAKLKIAELEQVFNAYESLSGFTLDRLASYGFEITSTLRDNITNYLKKTITVDDQANELEADTEKTEITGEEGRGLRDWADSPFELDPRDTASKRLKFFLASTVESEFGEEEAPPSANISFNNEVLIDQIVKGLRVYSVRTPSQVKNIKLTNNVGSVVLRGITYKVVESEVLNTVEKLEEWGDAFSVEGVDPEIGSVVYKLTPFVPEVNVPKALTNIMGTPQLANFEDLFTQLLAYAQDAGIYSLEGNVGYAEIVKSLKDSGKATLVRVADMLTKESQQMKNEFAKVMSKQYIEMSIVLFNLRRIEGKSDVIEGFPINANGSSQKEMIKKLWKETQKESPMVKNVKGKLSFDKNLVKVYQDSLAAALADPVLLRLWAENFMTDLGIIMPEGGLDYLIANTEAITKGSKLTGNFAKQFSFSKEGAPKGIFSALLNALVSDNVEETQEESEDSDELKDTLDANYQFRANNPLYTETTAINKLVDVAAKFGSIAYAKMHKSAENKNIYAYGLHTYESHAFRSILANEGVREQMLTTAFAKNSWLLNELHNDPTERGKVKLMYLDGLQATNDRGNGTVRTDMSPREQELTVILSFQRKGGERANFFDLTKSDKSTTPILANVKKLMISSLAPSKLEMKEMYNVFDAEFQRIKKWEADKGTHTDEQFAAGGGLFYLLPQFNFEEMSKARRKAIITKEEFDSVWNADGTVSSSENVVSRKQIVDAMNGLFLTQMDNKLIRKWRSMGISTDENTWFDLAWKKKTERVLNIHKAYDKDGNITTIVDASGPAEVFITEKDLNRKLTQFAARELNVNYFLVTTSTAQMISGDPALAYKGKPGQSQLIQVRETLKEYQKRLAKDIGPGSDPTWDKNSSYTTITIEDPTLVSYMEKYNKEYGGKDSAGDAQELTTVREHLFVMFSEGKIPDKIYEEMIAIIDEGIKTPNKYYEFTKAEHKAIVLQAMKPVYVGRRFSNGTMHIDYVKSSSFPLLPSITQNNELDKLRQEMEGDGESTHVARVHYASAKKMGRPIKTLKLFDKNGLIIKGVFKTQAWKVTARQRPTREGFRIQQETPYDEFKEEITNISQMDKLIVEGIGDMDNFIYKGVSINGNALRKIKEDIKIKQYNAAYAKFLTGVGAVETIIPAQGQEKERKVLTFKDVSKFYDRLEQEAIDRNYPKSDLDAIRHRRAGGSLSIPLWFNGSSDRFESLMMSMIKKIVAGKMPGKSFIQASSLGFKNISTEIPKSGMVYAEDYNPSQGLRMMDKYPDGSTRPAQVLVPFNFFAKDGTPLKIEDFTKTLEDGKVVIDNAKLPDELRRFIGARIPNQGHNSMVAMEIVGFLPANMGDLMIVPAEITTQMGSDFDVDKLYVYKKNYSYFDNKLVPYSNENETKKSLQDDYFNVHWSVLTHPDMFDKVTKLLDNADLKTEKTYAEARLNADTFQNFFSISDQLDDFVSQKDAKVMVGLTSLTSTFNAVIQNKGLKLMKSVYDESSGKTTKIPLNIVFKEESSDSLVKLNVLSGTGVARHYETENPDASTPYKVRTKHDNITTLQNEVLDHAKNRVIDALNLNRYTYAASAALSMLEDTSGLALSVKYNARLMQQPIIVEYAKAMAMGGDSLTAGSSSGLKQRVFEELRLKYGKLFTPQELDDINEKPIAFSPQMLTKMLESKEQDSDYFMNQLSALAVFEQLNEVGELVQGIQAALNQDTNGAGANLLDAINKAEKADSVRKQGTIVGVSKMFDLGTQQGRAYDLTMNTAIDLFSEVLPYNKMSGIFDQISISSLRETLTLEVKREISYNMRSFIYSLPSIGFSKNATKDRIKLLYDTAAGLSLAKRLNQAKATWGKDDFFLKRLSSNISVTDNQPNLISYSGESASEYNDSENIKSWTAMFSGTQEQQELAQDLVNYAFLMGGNSNASSFVKFVPIAYLTGTEISDNLNDLMNLESWSAILEGFTVQYFQHNPKRAPSLSSDLSETLNFITDDKVSSRVQEVIYLPQIKASSLNPKTQHLIKTADDVSFYPPVISLKTTNGFVLYRQSEQADESVTYRRIDTLGNGNFAEYDANRGYARTSILTNRALGKLNKDQEDRSAPLTIGVSKKVEDTVFYSEFIDENQVETTVESVVANLTVEEAPLLHLMHGIAQTNKRLSAPVVVKELTVDQKENASADGKYIAGLTTFGKVSNPTIFIDPLLTDSRPRIAMVLTHEYAHHISHSLVRFVEELGRAKAEAEFGKEAVQAYYELKELMAFVAEALPKTPRNNYATSSVHEFIAHVMSDKQYQKLLNGLEFKESSAWEKFVSIFEDMLKALAQHLGFPINKDSALEASLKSISKILAEKTSTENTSQSLKDALIQTELYSEDLFDEVYDDEFDLNRVEDSNELTIPEPIQAALKSLKHIKTELQNKQIRSTRKLNEEERQEYVQRESEINKITQEIQNLKNGPSLGRLIETGLRQMIWVDYIVNKPNISQVEILSTVDTTSTWGNLMSTLNSSISLGGLPPEAQQLIGQIEQLKSAALARFQDSTIKSTKNRVNSNSDFTPLSMSVGFATAQTRDLSQVKSEVGQEIFTVLKEVNLKTAEEERRFRIKVDAMNIKIKNYAKANGMKEDDVHALFRADGDKWALTDVFTGDFYKFQRDLRVLLFTKLSQAEAVLDPIAKTDLVKAAWKSYHKKVSDNLVYVDTTVFFEEETGDYKPDDKRTKEERAKLIAEVGEDTTNTLIEKAREAYLDFLMDKESHEEAVRARYEEQLSDPDIKFMDSQRLKQQQVNDLNEWEGHNSPNVFFNSLKNVFNKGINPRFNNYGKLVMAPKSNAADGPFFDEKFVRIMEDPKLAEIYDFMKTNLDTFKSFLPDSVSQELGDNFLPVMDAGTSNFKIGQIGKVIGDVVLNALTAEQEYLDYHKSAQSKIPIRYTSDKLVEKADREVNLMVMLEKFGKMAYHYKNASKAQAYAELLQQMIVRGVSQTPDGGAPINSKSKNLADQAQYMIDSVLYEKAKEIEFEGGKVYSLNLITQYKIQNEVTALNDQKKELSKKYQLGEITMQEYNDAINAINEQLASKKYRKIVGSKLGDAAIKITELKALAYNPMSAVANISFGVVSVFVHANARVDFGHKEARSAWATMLHATKKSVTMGSSNSETAKKILAFMERLNTMGELLDSENVGESRIKSNKSKLKSTLSPFALLRNSDYFMKGMVAVAMAKKQMVEVNGQQISLWDAMDNEGKVNGNEGWYSEDIDAQTEFLSFQKKAIAVTKVIMGNQDNGSTMLTKKKILGRLISQFRLSWMAEGIATRGEIEHYNGQLGRIVKGRYRTMYELGTVGSIKTLLMQAMSVFIKNDTFSTRKRDGESLSQVDIENMRRNLTEIAFFLSMVIAVVALRSMLDGVDDEDEKKKAATRMVLNMLIRNRQDISFFASTDIIQSNSVIPATKVIIDFNKAMAGTYKILAERNDPDSRFTGEQFATRWMRAIPYAALYPKFEYMWKRDLDTITQ